MGSPLVAWAAIAGMVAATVPAGAARAEPCTLTQAGIDYAVCFSPGDRLAVGADTGGMGAKLQLRHIVKTDDPAVHWRFEHRGEARAEIDGDYVATVYALRIMRHSRDGHLVLPVAGLRKIKVPFDIGGEVSAGKLAARAGEPGLDVELFRGALLFDFARSEDFGRRFAIGTAAKWTAELDPDQRALLNHGVAPFSLLVADLYAESDNGLQSIHLRGQAGLVWNQDEGWTRDLAAQATVERVLIAINDRPLSAYAQTAYHPGELSAAIGLRFALWTTSP